MEEHRLTVFENRVMKTIFGPKRDGVMGGWRSIIRIIKSRKIMREKQVARMEEKRIARRLLVGKQEGKRPLERQNLGGW
jgi:hypothetical protein